MNSSWQVDLFNRINDSTNMQDVLDSALKTTRNFGFEFCGWRSKLPTPLSQRRFSVMNSNEDRLTQERENGYYDDAPAVRHCATSNDPFFWNGTTEDEAFLKAPALFEEYYSTGHFAGWAQSVVENRNMFSMFYVDSKFRMTIEDIQHVDLKLQWVATAVLCKMYQIRLQPDIQLSEREKEVLRWSGDGKTASEISQILKLSSSTINFHMRSAMFKLSAPNKTAAVINAIYLGLLN